MKVRKTNPIDDLKYKEEEFLKLTPMQRLEINNTMKQRMFGDIHQDWAGMVVKKVKK